jgi:predicted molibdopterin-dependent oxidoreductase YjgC
MITDRVFPGLVWMALHFTEAKVNWLTHDVGDSLIGTPEYKVSAVRVEPRKAAIRTAAR